MSRSRLVQDGATLIEVLIALFIFAVTTVTATAMLLESLRSLNNAINGQHAARLASNLQAIMADIPRNLLVIPAITHPASPTTCNLEALCTPADWLASEFQRLQSQATTSLPAGRIELVEQSSGIVIRITWASHANDQRLTYTLQHDQA